MVLDTTNYTRLNTKTLGKFRRVLLELIADNYFDPAETLQSAFDLTKGHCFYCSKKLYFRDEDGYDKLTNEASLDHIVPALYFGVIAPGNAALSCKACNLEKGSKSVEDYYKSRFLAHRASYFDTMEELLVELTKLRELYDKNLPMLSLLSSQLKKGEMNEVSIETVIACAQVNPNPERQLMLPQSYVSKNCVDEEKEDNVSSIKQDDSDGLFAFYYEKIKVLSIQNINTAMIKDKINKLESSFPDVDFRNIESLNRATLDEVKKRYFDTNSGAKVFNKIFTGLAVISGNLEICYSKTQRIDYERVLSEKDADK